MLTIFSTCKPFRGHFAIIQRNAITSWTLLRPRPEIILFGDEEGVAEICAELGLRHVPEIARNEFGTPLLNDLFEKAQRLASHEILCYVNADIILMGDIIDSIQKISHTLKNPWWLLTGRCIYTDISEPLDFTNSLTLDNLRCVALQSGNLGPPDGTDYFLFPKGLFRDLLPLAVGRQQWHAWLLWYVVHERGGCIVDATKVIVAIHQNHPVKVANIAEVRRNILIGGDWAKYYSLSQAEFVLTERGLFRRRLRLVVRSEFFWRQLLDWTRPLRHALGLRQETVKALLQKLAR
jgi:hypothetical protein